MTGAAAPVLEHHARGRSLRTALVLALVWAGLIGMRLGLEAALWIVLGLALFTLPALWDLASDRRSGLRLDAEALAWWSGARRGHVPLTQIQAVRFDRRLDLSMRVSVVLQDARRIRLPQEALPEIERLEAALRSVGVATERHPFSLL